MFLLFFALLIFLLNSAILASICLFLFEGCSLRGAPLIGSLRTLGSNDLRVALDSKSLLVILSASCFIDLIFFLFNLKLALLEALVILSSSSSIWDFKLLYSASKFLNFFVSLESLACLCLSCRFVRGTCNSGLSLSSIGFHGPTGPETPWGSKFELVEVAEVYLVEEVDWEPNFEEEDWYSIGYFEEELLTQLFSIENNLSIHSLSRELLIQVFSRFHNCSPFL